MNETNEQHIKPYKSKYKLICASKCKKYALESAKINRPANKFTRVSHEFLVSCENALRQIIDSKVKSHPSKGKTLMQ
jgi:hypothetical protein